MTVLLHMSDPHFGTERLPVVEALRLFCRKLEPLVVVLSGDITQRARRKQFAAAQAFVASLHPARVLAIPGNHDIPLFDVLTRLLAPYREHRRAFGSELEPVLDADELLVVCVNTTRAYRHKDGEVSASQVEQVATRLSGARPEQLRVVVTHQPAAVYRKRDAENLLHGAAPALERWAAAGADLVLGGHIHLPYVLPMHERMVGLARRLWVVQAGTALSARIRHEADNSINVIRYENAAAPSRRAIVERWDYREESRRFELREQHMLDLATGQASR